LDFAGFDAFVEVAGEGACEGLAGVVAVVVGSVAGAEGTGAACLWVWRLVAALEGFLEGFTAVVAVGVVGVVGVEATGAAACEEDTGVELEEFDPPHPAAARATSERPAAARPRGDLCEWVGTVDSLLPLAPEGAGWRLIGVI
jgi:hypothetical protein